MDIVVLAGGLSSERDVSLATGGQIANALVKKGHRVLLVDSFIGLSAGSSFDELYEKYRKDDYSYKIPKTEPNLSALKREHGNGNALIGNNVLECCKMADVVFIGLHGSIGENGQLQAMLDIFDITYTGSGSLGSALAMDKFLSKELMIRGGVPTAPSDVLEISHMTPEEIKEKLRTIPLPFVVKPCSGGSSVGVTLVKQESDIEKALEYAKEYEDKILIEEFVEGREFSVGVLGNEALPAIEIVPKAEFFDYESKYQGTTDEICPADISEELEMQLRELSLRVHKILGLECYSRTDFMVDAKGDIFCLETNSLPGMTANSLLPQEARETGIEYSDLCEMIVKLALNKKGLLS